jgi:hypothetical protein
MQVTRIEEAPAYSAPLPHEVCGRRLQGHDATSTEDFWVGLSHFLPRDGAERSYAVQESARRHRVRSDHLDRR